MTGKRKSLLNDPSLLLLIIGLTAGLVLCVMIPFGTGFDEDQHLVRVFDIAGLDFLPNRDANGDTVAFSEFFTLSYRRYFFENQASNLLFTEYFNVKPDYRNMYYVKTRAVYPPLIYLPQAFIAGFLWIIYRFPIIPGTIILRMVGLLIYIFSAFISIKLLPFGRWVLLVLALAPTALYQASTVSADGYNNAVSFIFISYTLRHIITKDPFTTRQIALLVLLTLLIGFSKPGTVILVLLLLALDKNKFTSLSQRLSVWFAAVTSVALTIIWWKLSMGSAPPDLLGTNLQQNIPYILRFPGDFLIFLIRTTILSLRPYLISWIAEYGYWVGRVPEIVYWLFIITLAASLLVVDIHNKLSRKTRILLVFLSFVFLSSVLIQYNLVKYEPGVDISTLSAHGRYFIPFAVPLFIALSGIVNLPGLWHKRAMLVITVCSTLAMVFYILGLVTTYYAECREKIFSPNECTLPHYQNINTSSPPLLVVDKETLVQQQFINTCKKLTKVELLIGPTSLNKEDIFEFSILDGHKNVLYSSNFPHIDVQQPTRIGFEVSDVRFTQDELHIIQIDSVNSTNGLSLATRPVDAYPGQLRVNDSEVHSDVIFYYSCSK